MHLPGRRICAMVGWGLVAACLVGDSQSQSSGNRRLDRQGKPVDIGRRPNAKPRVRKDTREAIEAERQLSEFEQLGLSSVPASWQPACVEQPTVQAGLLTWVPGLENPLQQQLVRMLHFARNRTAAQTVEDTCGMRNSAADLYKFSDKLMSRTMLSMFTDTSSSTNARRLPQVACATVQAVNLHWHVLLQRATDMIESRAFEGMVIGRVRKYDESPFTLRVADSGELFPKHGGTGSHVKMAAATAKVVSSVHRLFMLLRARCAGQGQYAYCLLHGEAPSRLHVVETQHASNILACQRAVLQDVQISQELASKFKFQLSLPVTDRFSSMLAAEKHLHRGEGWLRCHNLCCIHKASSGQKDMFSMLESTVAGMLSAALATQKAGGMGRLREALYSLLEERLVVLPGPPTCEKFREAVYDVFLPMRGTKALQHQKQRLALSRLLNGNICDRSKVIHMSAEGHSRETVLLAFKEELLPALLPSAPPFFNRSKWLGGEDAVSFHGILASHHGLLPLLFERWAGVKADVVPRALRPAASTSGWGRVANQIVSGTSFQVARVTSGSSAAAPATLAGGDAFDVASLQPEAQAEAEAATAAEALPSATGDPDQDKAAWVRWNKRHKEKALAFVRSDPERALIAMRVCMGPWVRLLQNLCHLSAQSFDKQQAWKAQHGQPVSYRVLELYYGEIPRTFMEGVNTVFHAPVNAFPSRIGSSADTRPLMTRLLCKGLSSVHQSLFCMVEAFPQTLLRVLQDESHAAAVLQAPACMRDAMSQKILERFATEDALTSVEAKVVLAAIAQNLSVDTYEVERSFSTVRRRVRAKEVTWRPKISDIAAEFVISFARGKADRAGEFMRGCGKQRRQSLLRLRRKKRKSQQGGGAWRAFCRKRLAGKKFGTVDLKQLSRDYTELKGTPAFREFAELGAIAEARRKQGLRPFPAQTALTDGGPSGVLAAAEAMVPAVRDATLAVAVRTDVKELTRAHRQDAKAALRAEGEESSQICSASAALQSSQGFARWAGIHEDLACAEKHDDSCTYAPAQLPMIVSEFIPPATDMCVDAWHIKKITSQFLLCFCRVGNL